MTLEKIKQLSILEDNFKVLNGHYATICRNKGVLELEKIAENFEDFFTTKNIEVNIVDNNASPRTKKYIPNLGRMIASLSIHYPLEIYDFSFDEMNEGYKSMFVSGSLELKLNLDLKKNIFKDIFLEPNQRIIPFSFENEGNIDFKIKSTTKKISDLNNLINSTDTISFEYFLLHKDKDEYDLNYHYDKKKVRMSSIQELLKSFF